MTDKTARLEITEAIWMDLWPHAQRNAVILVSPGHGISLPDAAHAVATDQKERVQEWVDNGILAKPTDSQLSAWSKQPHKLFYCAVVQPFVVAQEILEN